MMYAGGERTTPAPAQFALRVAILGAAALVVFSIIFFRLWYLEVLSGDKYLAEAQNNQVREFTVQAPRGEILDSEGKVLVDNRVALALQVREEELPALKRRRERVIDRLAGLTDLEPEGIEREIRRQTRLSPASPVTLKRDVPYNLVYYLRENEAEFPGVSIDRVYVRRYPQGSLAAHMFGYVREVSADQLEDPRYETLEPGDQIGITGVESTYDEVLRGVNGASRVQVDASGRPTGRQLQLREPKTGNTLRLTLDPSVQRAGEQALASFGNPGAFVAMDVDDGSILGLGSYPTFDPSFFGRPVIPTDEYQALQDPDNGNALSNRAIQGLYPTGSTFKPITALAALDDGLISPTEPVDDPGSITVGGVKFENAGGVAHGSVDMRTALQVSSDVYFYKLGIETNPGEGIQRWASDLSLGGPTGVDLPAEGTGLLPTPQWRNDLYEQANDPDSPSGEEIVFGETDRPWSVGDNVNLSVGQGDLQANPLQMAVAYATIANGGEVVRPHVAMRVEDPSGRVVQEVTPEPRRQVGIDPLWRDTIMEGLHDAAMAPGGTSYSVFGGFPVQVAGKTGTAERPPFGDQSWYVVMAPYPDPEVVVAVTIEQGGFGAEAAAPAAREILQAQLKIDEQEIDSVEDPSVTVTPDSTGVVYE